MMKAVKRARSIIELHTDMSNIPDTIIDEIVSSSMGDIRCAVNQFYFTCSKGIYFHKYCKILSLRCTEK